MNGEIPEALLAIADEAVKMELRRIAPQKCQLCTPERRCWFHEQWHRMEHRNNGDA